MTEVIDIQNVCRICLRLRNLMVSLECSLNEAEAESSSIREVLQDLFSIKLKLSNDFPGNICYVCLEVLRNAFQLKQQFLDTDNLLKSVVCAADIPNENATVEIIVGKKKFDLKDIVIIEDENDEVRNYNGFLNNLGKTISASFVGKDGQTDAKRISEENPIVVIERKNTHDICENFDTVENVEDKYTVENTKLNANDFDISNLHIPDQEIFRSALNIRLKCNICQKLYSKKWRLLKHLQTCGEPEIAQSRTSPETFSTCSFCNKVFQSKCFLDTHIKRMHSVYTCDICEDTFPTRSGFYYHQKTKHIKDFFICQYCGKKCLTNNSLNIHTLTHTHRDKAQCICPVCGKTFHYSGGLFYHMKIHNNERKYCCLFCDRRFYTTTAQQRHIRTHTGERPYACKYCNRRFFSNSELKKHLYLHTGNMPHHCLYCKKGFTCKYNLKKHMIKHPGNYKCTFCGKGFISFEVLKFHCSILHKDNK